MLPSETGPGMVATVSHRANNDSADLFTQGRKASLVQLLASRSHTAALIWTGATPLSTVVSDNRQLTDVAVLARPAGDTLAEVATNQVAA